MMEEDKKLKHQSLEVPVVQDSLSESEQLGQESEKPHTSYHSCLSGSNDLDSFDGGTSYHTTLDQYSTGTLSFKMRGGFRGSRGTKSVLSQNSLGSGGTTKLIIESKKLKPLSQRDSNDDSEEKSKKPRKASEAVTFGGNPETLSATSGGAVQPTQIILISDQQKPEPKKRTLGLLTKARINRSNLNKLDKGGAKPPGSESVGGQVSGDESSSVSSPVKRRQNKTGNIDSDDIVKEFSSEGEQDLSVKASNSEKEPPKAMGQSPERQLSSLQSGPTEQSKEEEDYPSSTPSYTLQDLVRRTACGDEEIGVMQHNGIVTQIYKKPTLINHDILDQLIQDQHKFIPMTSHSPVGPSPAIALNNNYRGRGRQSLRTGDRANLYQMKEAQGKGTRKLSDYCYAEEDEEKKEKNNNDRQKKRQNKVQRMRRYEDRLQEVMIQSEIPLYYSERDVHCILNYKSNYYNQEGGAENLFYLEFDIQNSLKCGFLSVPVAQMLARVDQTMVEEGEFTFALNGVLFGENVFAFDLLYKLTGKKLIKSMQKCVEEFKVAFHRQLRMEQRGEAPLRLSGNYEEGKRINHITQLYTRVINVSKNFGFFFEMPKLKYIANLSTGFNQIATGRAQIQKFAFQFNLPNSMLDGRNKPIHEFHLRQQKANQVMLQFFKHHSYALQRPAAPFSTSFASSRHSSFDHPGPLNHSYDALYPHNQSPVHSAWSLVQSPSQIPNPHYPLPPPSFSHPTLHQSQSYSYSNQPLMQGYSQVHSELQHSPYVPSQHSSNTLPSLNINNSAFQPDFSQTTLPQGQVSSQTLPQSFFKKDLISGMSTSGGGIVRAHLQKGAGRAEQESIHSVSSRSTKRSKGKKIKQKTTENYNYIPEVQAVPMAGNVQSVAAWSPYSCSQTGGQLPGSFYLNSPALQSYPHPGSLPYPEQRAQYSENRTLFGDELAPVEEHDSSLTNLERFLTISTPFMGEQHENMTLSQFWKSFDESCATGIESVLISENGEALVTYFIPTLSACEIHLKSPPPYGLPSWYQASSSNWSGAKKKGQSFSFVERAAPHQRKVVSEVVRSAGEKKEGEERKIGIGEEVKISQLDDSSWFAILWKFLKMIETGPPVITSFLVYYQFKQSSEVRFEPYGRKQMGYLPVIGLIGDKLDSRFWLTPSDPVSFEYDEIIKFFVNNEGSDLYNQLEQQAMAKDKLIEIDHHDLHFILERNATYYP